MVRNAGRGRAHPPDRGGPGTGKTVVALHRVKHLLMQSPDGGRILLTIFTNALAATLRKPSR